MDRQVRRNRLLLPKMARRRLVLAEGEVPAGDFQVLNHRSHLQLGLGGPLFAPSLYTRKIYHTTVLTVTALTLARVDGGHHGRLSGRGSGL